MLQHYKFLFASMKRICDFMLAHSFTYKELKGKVKGKTVSVLAWSGPEGSTSLTVPEFLDNQRMKVVSLSALRPGCLYPL